ncbi:MAG TPA: phosphatase PAP2 family protein [Acidimicrobiales bacterium]|nr:phosphatase PAP2 family protein [Acidimicrobiales bacterium]
MTPVLDTALIMLIAGVLSFLPFRYWTALRLGPRIDPDTVRSEVRRHPRLAAAATRRLEPSTLTGLALTVSGALVVAGAALFGLIFFMIRGHFGFADFDVSLARFAARHATHGATTVLRIFTQLGGAVVLVPLTFVVWLVFGRRRGLKTSLAFLLLTVGGQFALADLVKWIVDRTRPNFDRLTGFSGPSFPSGHATASACCLAAFALLIGAGRSTWVQALLASAAVALAAGIASSRVFLGVHWFTDVIGGLTLGWTWFTVCSIAFSGRLLDFGRPVEQMEQTVKTELLR